MISRSVDKVLVEALQDTPVIMIMGPRQAGKSTLARSLPGYSFRTLDLASDRAAAKRDPDGFIAELDLPVVLDEVQRVPELFPAIKYVVDQHRVPGRFVLTGSANVLLLPEIAESLAGRIELLTLWPFSIGELAGTTERFIERCFDPEFSISGRPVDRSSLVDQVLRGGFPEAIERSPGRREEWFGAYVSTIIERDMRSLADLERADAVPDMLALLAERVRAPLNLSGITSALEISEPTARRYLALLERIYFVQRTLPYRRSVGKRVVKAPRVALCDVGMLAYLLQADAKRLAQSDALFGTLLEALVGDELRKQATWARPTVSVHYLRATRGEEIDYILATRDGRVVAIEVKAAATVREHDFKALSSLRDRLTDRFVRGLVLYTGESTLPFGDRIQAVPVSALWSD